VVRDTNARKHIDGKPCAFRVQDERSFRLGE
jgi:hypothetical protein